MLDVWDWSVGDNYVLKMQQAVAHGRTVALFSAAYVEPGRFTSEESTAAIAARQSPVPVRIDGSVPPANLRPLLAASLVGLDEPAAVETLPAAVEGRRPGPTTAPAFPGSDRGPVSFPGGRDASVPMLPGQLPRVWNLPLRNPDFTGRDELLTALREALTLADRSRVQVLHGRGGVGKTQLAIEHAHRFAGEYELAWWAQALEKLEPRSPASHAVRGALTGMAPPPSTADTTTG
ncbi:hypothetical protein TN53_36380 [Streptomyces sp. WM6386]|nr:hypothetical protein TN53_36380 [Streptomyces sp. WM6386]